MLRWRLERTSLSIYLKLYKMAETTNTHETANGVYGVLPAGLMSVDEIKAIRNKLPDNWKWNKVYELPYINSRTGREFCLKHWALTAPDGNGLVCSLGLISHDHHTENHKKFLDNDVPVEWVEKSLQIVDSLIAEIECLKGSR